MAILVLPDQSMAFKEHIPKASTLIWNLVLDIILTAFLMMMALVQQLALV